MLTFSRENLIDFVYFQDHNLYSFDKENKIFLLSENFSDVY